MGRQVGMGGGQLTRDSEAERRKIKWEQNNGGGGRESRKGGTVVTVTCSVCTRHPQC